MDRSLISVQLNFKFALYELAPKGAALLAQVTYDQAPPAATEPPNRRDIPATVLRRPGANTSTLIMAHPPVVEVPIPLDMELLERQQILESK